MIQGKTKIQLFDSNGRLENEIVEKNMVTNALQYLVSPDVCMLGENTINSLIKGSMPFYSNALGGIMLFDENIDENAETVFKPNGVNIVGHAGSAYSGTNVMRGSYNTNESGELKDDNLQRIGYRHVWDFGTDKANGTIKCLSLTSLNGGNNAYKPILNDGTKKYNRTLYNSVGDTHGRFLGQINKNTFARLRYETRDGVTGFWLDHIQMTPKNNISIFENTGFKIVFSRCLGITTALPNNDQVLYALAPDDDGYAYICKVNSSGTVTYSKFSILTGDVEEGTITITVPSGYTLITPCCVIFKTIIIVLLNKSDDNSSSAAIYDLNGNLVRIQTNINQDRSYVYAESDNGKLCFSVAPSAFYIFEDDTYMNQEAAFTSGHWGGSQYRYKNGIYNLSGAVNPTSSSKNYIYVTRRDDYIATINNLATPVVKTNTQTMKITYDITEV